MRKTDRHQFPPLATPWLSPIWPFASPCPGKNWEGGGRRVAHDERRTASFIATCRPPSGVLWAHYSVYEPSRVAFAPPSPGLRSACGERTEVVLPPGTHRSFTDPPDPRHVSAGSEHRPLPRLPPSRLAFPAGGTAAEYAASRSDGDKIPAKKACGIGQVSDSQGDHKKVTAPYVPDSWRFRAVGTSLRRTFYGDDGGTLQSPCFPNKGATGASSVGRDEWRSRRLEDTSRSTHCPRGGDRPINRRCDNG
jgi:hypothetical protein